MRTLSPHRRPGERPVPITTEHCGYGTRSDRHRTTISAAEYGSRPSPGRQRRVWPAPIIFSAPPSNLAREHAEAGGADEGFEGGVALLVGEGETRLGVAALGRLVADQ